MTTRSNRFRRVIASDASGAIVLAIATVVALLWSNLSPASYDGFWHTPISISAGDARLEMSLLHWINDGIMTIFFFLVTLEVKKEFVLGDLRNWRHASVSVLSAALGMLIPALLFVLITWRSPYATAWGVVISTDTAFVLGILAAFGRRIPSQLRVLLLALAVVDDIGAILVIALVYTDSIDPGWVVVALTMTAVVFAAQRMRVWRGTIYVGLGVLLWIAVVNSGIHASIAGVVLALLLPVFPPHREHVGRTEDLAQGFRRSPTAAKGKAAAEGILSSISVNDRLQLQLARAVTYLVVPVFALANAGVRITAETLAHAFGSVLTWGIVISLVAGKFIGISIAPWMGRLFRVGALPAGLRRRHLVSGALLSGIGFTISLLIVNLAFEDPVAQADARIGVLSGSLIAAVLGAVALGFTTSFDAAHRPERIELARPVDPSRDHVQGRVGAPLVLVEYGTFGEYDDLAAEDVVATVRERYGDDLAFVFRYLAPGSDYAPERTPEALEAASAQDPSFFWTMRSELNRLSERGPLDDEQVLQAAVTVGADLAWLEEDLRRSAFHHRVAEDFQDADAMNLTTAPTFFVNGLVYTGPLQSSGLIAALSAARSDRDQEARRADERKTDAVTEP